MGMQLEGTSLGGEISAVICGLHLSPNFQGLLILLPPFPAVTLNDEILLLRSSSNCLARHRPKQTPRERAAAKLVKRTLGTEKDLYQGTSSPAPPKTLPLALYDVCLHGRRDPSPADSHTAAGSSFFKEPSHRR